MSKVSRAMDKARQMRAFQEPVSRPIEVEEIPAAPVPVPPMPPMNGGSGERPSGLADAAPLDEDLIVTTQPELRMTEGRFGAPDDHLVSLVAPNSMEAEQYRVRESPMKARRPAERGSRIEDRAVAGREEPESQLRDQREAGVEARRLSVLRHTLATLVAELCETKASPREFRSVRELAREESLDTPRP